MRDRLEQRLKELEAEYEAGQQMLAELEARQATLRDTLLRINGAVTVLREELEVVDQAREDAPSQQDGATPAANRPQARPG